MKYIVSSEKDKRITPLVQKNDLCVCNENKQIFSGSKDLIPPYITGMIQTVSGVVPKVSTKLSRRDRWETVKARISAFRMNYSVRPGLYAVGEPDKNADVFIAANYKMSFDALRSALDGLNAWILVLDTSGINVWCAAGKGTFGTSELLKRIKLSRIEEVVSHRKLILPQLGAPGINSGEVRRISGFRVMYGPVRAEDIGEYISNGYKCDQEMRLVQFDIIDRLILTPIEIRQILSRFHYFAIFVLVFFGLTPEGVIFKESLLKGYFFLWCGILVVFSGALFTPVFLPFIPFRAFSVKGWISGLIIFLSVFYIAGVLEEYNIFLIISALTLFPALSSYMALQFTGASTFTSLSGVKKEIRVTMPVYIGAGILSLIFLILYKLSDWGII